MAQHKRLSEQAWDTLEHALTVFYWRKADLRRFLHSELRDHLELFGGLNFDETKRTIVGELVSRLRVNEDKYQDLVLGLLVRLSEFDPSFPRLGQETDKDHLVDQAQTALAAVRKVVVAYSEEVQQREAVRNAIEEEARRGQGRRAHREALAGLHAEFLDLWATSSSPQQRGIAFESLLNRLMALFDMQPRAAYRLESEQIDGAFEFRTDDYLLEARWWSGPVEPKHLRDFDGKIRQKARNVLGLFISVNGFTKGALEHRAEATPLILMDGQDLLAVLEDRIELDVLLDRKRRHAAETGSPWLPVSPILGT